MFLRRLLGVLVEDVRSGADGRGGKRVDAGLICLQVCLETFYTRWISEL